MAFRTGLSKSVDFPLLLSDMKAYEFLCFKVGDCAFTVKLHPLNGLLPDVRILDHGQCPAGTMTGGAFFQKQRHAFLQARPLGKELVINTPETLLHSGLLGLDMVPDKNFDVLVFDRATGFLLHSPDNVTNLILAHNLVEKDLVGMTLAAFFLEKLGLLLLPSHMELDQLLNFSLADFGMMHLPHPGDGGEPDLFRAILTHDHINVVAFAAFGLKKLFPGGRGRIFFRVANRLEAEGGEQDE